MIVSQLTIVNGRRIAVMVSPNQAMNGTGNQRSSRNSHGRMPARIASAPIPDCGSSIAQTPSGGGNVS